MHFGAYTAEGMIFYAAAKSFLHQRVVPALLLEPAHATPGNVSSARKSWSPIPGHGRATVQHNSARFEDHGTLWDVILEQIARSAPRRVACDGASDGEAICGCPGGGPGRSAVHDDLAGGRYGSVTRAAVYSPASRFRRWPLTAFVAREAGCMKSLVSAGLP